MDSFKGTLMSGEVRGPFASKETNIKRGIVTNKTNSLVVFNLYIVINNNIKILICPKDMELQANECYSDCDIILKTGENLLLKSSGEVDYYFSIF